MSLDTAMLVRSHDGAWEKLQPQDVVPSGGITEIFGDDLGPVLGATEPMFVVATAPKLAAGRPDAICVTPSGQVSVVMLTVGRPDPGTLPTLLSHAGSMQAMDYDEFEKACNTALGAAETLGDYVEARSKEASVP